MRLKYESYIFERHLILVIQVATLNYKSLIENIIRWKNIKIDIFRFYLGSEE